MTTLTLRAQSPSNVASYGEQTTVSCSTDESSTVEYVIVQTDRSVAGRRCRCCYAVIVSSHSEPERSRTEFGDLKQLSETFSEWEHCYVLCYAEKVFLLSHFHYISCRQWRLHCVEGDIPCPARQLSITYCSPCPCHVPVCLSLCLCLSVSVCLQKKLKTTDAKLMKLDRNMYYDEL